MSDITSAHNVNALKSDGRYRDAGRAAFLQGSPDYYGAHIGMRSGLAAAREAFHAGWREAYGEAQGVPADAPRGRDLGEQANAHMQPWHAVRYLAGAIADIARDYAYDLDAIATLDTREERREAHERAMARRCERSTRLAADCITLDIRHQAPRRA